MKEIKFREFINGKFHYWGFVEEGIFKGPVTPSLTRGVHSQFIGLLDQYKKEIYEGDILIEGDSIEKFGYPLVVTFGEYRHDKDTWGISAATTGFCLKYKDGAVTGIHNINDAYGFCALEMNVIGNIYQNPELL